MTRIEREKQTVKVMIELYCRKKHGGKELCADCRQLTDYSFQRLDHCKYGDNKPACSNCPIHCYRPDMREQIRRVMRFAGPRMIVYYPLMAIRHAIHSSRKK